VLVSPVGKDSEKKELIFMSLVISDELLKAAKVSEDELMQEIVLLLFQQDKLSLGKASHLLGISQMEFQKLLASRKICLHYDVEEFREDIKSLQAREWR
jgi:predicted HTH domain antitoxin